MILLFLAGYGQEYPAMPILDIPHWTCHRHKKRERKGKGKMLGCHFIWLKEDLEAVRESIADDGHHKIRGIRKVHWIIKSNKPNGVKSVYFMQLSHTITCLFSKYFEILYIFAQIFKYFSIFQHFFALFMKNHSPFPLLSRIGPGCIYFSLINLVVYLLESMDFYVMSASKVELKVVRLQSQINIFDTTLMFWKQNGTSSTRLTVMKIMMRRSLKKLICS